MKLVLLGIVLLLTLVQGSTLKLVADNTGNVTDQPRSSSSFGPFRDVQSVSEYDIHSTTPTITLLKELVSAYDDEAEYAVKKQEIMTTTNKVVEVTTGQAIFPTDKMVQNDQPVTTSSTTTKTSTTTSTPTTTKTTTKATTTVSPTTTTAGTTRPIPPRTTPRTTPPTRPTTPKHTRTTPVQLPVTTTTTTTARTTTQVPRRVVAKQPVQLETRNVPVKGSYQQSCPRPEDIHPCECIEIRSHQNPNQVETVSFCKNIRNTEVLKDAMKGMQGHYINFFVVDSCKMPPFPNGLFQNVGIGWMEMLNSTLQFHEKFFSCSNGCW